MMRFAAAFLIAGTAPAAAQSMAGPLQRFHFSGCDVGWSCMYLVVTTPANRHLPNGFDVHFAWTVTYEQPGGLESILVEGGYAGDDYIGPASAGFTRLGSESGAFTEWRGIGWTPAAARYTVYHGPLGTHAYDGTPRTAWLQLTHTTVTPEPASLLLLGTGVAAVFVHRRRRPLPCRGGTRTERLRLHLPALRP